MALMSMTATWAQPREKLPNAKAPTREFAGSARSVPGPGSLLQVKRAQILPDDLGHRHAKSGGEILFGHLAHFLSIAQKLLHFERQALRAASLVEADRQTFVEGHLAKVGDTGRYDWDAEFAGKVGYAAGSSGGRIRQHQTLAVERAWECPLPQHTR